MRSLGWNVALAPNPETIRAMGSSCGLFIFFPEDGPAGVQIRDLGSPNDGKRERCIRGGWPGLEAIPSPERAVELLRELAPGEQRDTRNGL